MRSLAHTVPSRLVIPFGVRFSFNFGNTLFNFYSDLVLIPILVAILLVASH